MGTRRGAVLAMAALLLACVTSPARADWQWVGEGDCVGPQLQGAPGDMPEPARCNSAMAGKVALCFPKTCNPGCQYIDMPVARCQIGADTGQIYTCLPDPHTSGR